MLVVSLTFSVTGKTPISFSHQGLEVCYLPAGRSVQGKTVPPKNWLLRDSGQRMIFTFRCIFQPLSYEEKVSFSVADL